MILKGHPVPTLSHLHAEYRKAVLQSSTALSKYTGQDMRIAGHFGIGELKYKIGCLRNHDGDSHEDSINLHT